jgi:hypothetical protein
MTLLLRISQALLASALVCGAVEAQDVTYDFDRTTDFSRLRSFAFTDTDSSSTTPFLHDRLFGSITRELSLRGMTKSDTPDVLIRAHLSTEIRNEVRTWGYGGWYGSYGWYGPYSYYPYGLAWGAPYYEVLDVRYDTITIEMTDARTGTLVWQGRGVKRVGTEWDPEELDEKVYKTTRKILKNYPPGWDDDDD